MKRKNKQIKDKVFDIIEMIIWAIILGFGIYLNVRLIIGLMFNETNAIFFYGFALVGYVSAIILVLICCIFAPMIFNDDEGEDEE